MAIESQRKYGQLIFLFAIIIFLTVCDLLLLRASFTGEYLNLPALIFLFILLFFTVISIRFLLSINLAEIFDYDVLILSIFGKEKAKFSLSDMLSWTENYRSTRSGGIYILIIYGNDFKYSFRSDFIKNYKEIKAALTEKAQRDTELENKKTQKFNRNSSYVAIGLGLILLFIVLINFFLKADSISSNNIVTISGTVSNNSEVFHSRHGSSFTICLNEYPDFRFEVSEPEYKVFKTHDSAHNFFISDTVLIDIKKDDYNKKISHTQQLSFFDKTIGYENISVYGVRDMMNNTSYLNLQEVNQAENNDRYSMFVFFLIFGFFFLAIGSFYLNKSKKTKKE